MFESRKELFSKIAALEADNKRLETELLAEQGKVAESGNQSESLAALNEDLEAAQTENKDLTAKLENAETEHKTALATEQAKTTPEAIQTLVTAELVKSGHPPIEFKGGETDKVEETKTRAEFASLDNPAKAAFIRNGGKLTD